MSPGSDNHRGSARNPTGVKIVSDPADEIVRLEPDATAASGNAEPPAEILRLGTSKNRKITARTTPLTPAAPRPQAESWEKPRTEKSHSHAWLWLTGALIALALIATLIFLPRITGRAGKKPAASPPAAAREEIPVSTDDAISRQMISLLQQDGAARELFLRYATAPDNAAVLPLVFRRETAAPLLEKSPHTAQAPAGWKPTFAKYAVIAVGTRAVSTLACRLPDGTPILVVFQSTPDGLRIDWEGTTGYSSAPFSDLFDGSGDASCVRGILKPGRLYSAAFPEETFACYTLGSPDGAEFIWLYLRRDTPLAAEISRTITPTRLLPASSPSGRVTLALARPDSPDARKNQWIIKSLIATDWAQAK